jgi:arylsulfatase A-like enzyme
MYPHRLGVIEGFMCHKKRMDEFKKKGKALINLNRIPSDVPTMPEIFQSAGYLTLGVAANINIGSAMGFDRGFDRFELFQNDPASTLYGLVKSWINDISPSKKPVFLYTHFNDPHYPYVKHYLDYEKPVDKKYEPRAKYLSEIRYLDKYIGKLYDFMGANSNTIFVVVSDHGEEFWDHGKVGHKSGLHRELTNVLTMFHAPFLGLKPAGIDVNISLIDVLPTILDLIGFRKVSGMEGLSLVPILKSDDRSTNLKELLDDRTIFAHRMLEDPQTQFWAAINRHWNMIELPDSKKVLFDHRNDLPEKQDVFSGNTGITDGLIKKLEYFKGHGSRVNIETTPVDMDKDLLDELKSLGYVDG